MTQIRSFNYGGGVNSTAGLVLAGEGEIDFNLFPFSNVGNDSEHPATLKYVREVAMPYAEKHGIELIELRKQPKGKERTLYSVLTRETSRSIDIPMFNKNGKITPRSCTTHFKIQRITAYLKVIGATNDNPAITALGISIDEFERMRTDSGVAWQKLVYPLVDLRITRQDCINIIERAGLPVPPKSSCWFCPFHSIAQWRHLKENTPHLFDAAVALEAQMSNRRVELGRDPIWITPRGMPLDRVVQGTQHDMFEVDDTCESGYCHT